MFLMYAQTKTTRQCTVCKDTVVCYQPYSILGLPVPDANLMVVPIILHLVPAEVKIILEDIYDQMLVEEGDADFDMLDD